MLTVAYLCMLTLLTLMILSCAASFCPAALPPPPPLQAGLLGLEISADDTDYVLREGDSILFSGSRQACRAERLRLLQQRHGRGRWNVRCATLGGKQYWADHYIIDGWRIQQHCNTGHYRLLNPRDVRYAWGSYAACRTALALQRSKNGYGQKIESDVVVILHGIFRSKDAMSKPAQALSNAGYEVININYPSCKAALDDFAKQVNALLNKREDLRQVSFVTHSMGALVLRQLLSDADQPWRQRVELGRAVLIFPPNQGAHKANIWHRRRWYRCVFGPAGRQLCSDIAADLPLLPLQTGIIAGAQGDARGKSRIIPGDDDGTVGIDEVTLDGVSDYAYHKVGHTFGMNKEPVLKDIVSYINAGRFL